jgi:SAM-dependent methyltransferase
MVNVTQHEPPGAVRDAAAMDIFRHQWELYRKFLKYDYLSNAGAYAGLHRFLMDDLARPFRFVDLACGDASGIVTALKGTAINHYRGVDLAEPALALAQRNLEALPCEVELEQADFSEAMRNRRRPDDIVWISLSLHHLNSPDKLALMREVRAGIEPQGAFLIYEPTRRDGEDRAAYLDRFEDIGRREWTALTPDEFKEGMKHVRTCDIPETVSDWDMLGREAGFSETAELYKARDDLFRMFLYRP